MIDDESMRTIVAVFFSLFGLFHFLFGRHVERYAIDGGLLNSFIAVRMSGALMVVGSVALFFDKYRVYGCYAICIFLLLSAIIMHKFWEQETLSDQIKEFLQFMKNILLTLFLWHLSAHF